MVRAWIVSSQWTGRESHRRMTAAFLVSVQSWLLRTSKSARTRMSGVFGTPVRTAFWNLTSLDPIAEPDQFPRYRQKPIPRPWFHSSRPPEVEFCTVFILPDKCQPDHSRHEQLRSGALWHWWNDRILKWQWNVQIRGWSPRGGIDTVGLNARAFPNARLPTKQAGPRFCRLVCESNRLHQWGSLG